MQNTVCNLSYHSILTNGCWTELVIDEPNFLSMNESGLLKFYSKLILI